MHIFPLKAVKAGGSQTGSPSGLLIIDPPHFPVATVQPAAAAFTAPPALVPLDCQFHLGESSRRK